jgi:hypothetical protein
MAPLDELVWQHLIDFLWENPSSSDHIHVVRTDLEILTHTYGPSVSQPCAMGMFVSSSVLGSRTVVLCFVKMVCSKQVPQHGVHYTMNNGNKDPP